MIPQRKNESKENSWSNGISGASEAKAVKKMSCASALVIIDLPSLEKVLIVPSKKDSKLKDISGIKNSCFLDEFLKLGIGEDGSVPTMEFEQVSFSHPVAINFTSGTTGSPKAMMHGCGTDHLIGTSAHGPQHPMAMYTGMGTVGPDPHGLFRH
ncbi:acetoacetyl-CoA synthetase [Trichonephila clavipes]|nr:acetoacetyl-CoA synthetase [Trichonephila clavipes]